MIFFRIFPEARSSKTLLFFQALTFSKGEENSPKVCFSTIVFRLTQLDPKATEVNEIICVSFGDLGVKPFTDQKESEILLGQPALDTDHWPKRSGSAPNSEQL